MGWVRPTLMVLSTLLVLAGLVMYFRGEGICSLDEAKRQRKRIINTSIVVLPRPVSYIVFNFIIDRTWCGL